MLIYLVRHGQKNSNPNDPGLTNLGIKQARQTGKFFKDKKIGKILCSPFQRTLQTAQIIAQITSLNPAVSDDLRERAEWTGNLSFQKFEIFWIKSSSERSWQPPIGDSSIDAGKRLEQIITQHKNTQSLVIVTHGGLITDFLRNIVDDKYLINNFFKTIKNLRETNIPNCSITTIKKEDENFKILELFSTSHLKEIENTTYN